MIQLTKDRIAVFFNQVFSTIEQTPETIYTVFPDGAFNLLQIDKMNKSVLEITTEFFTLSCQIDEHNRCNASYIFINKSEELETVKRIIEYCTRTFPYSHLLKIWIMEGHLIDIQLMDQSILFIVSKMKPLPDELKKYLMPDVLLNPS